ncbi:hypothetical protein Ddc_10193 [Ditylenchus destructor]|nr:hypothetical protein Ddc_10193 [Ditylenchus destructor]
MSNGIKMKLERAVPRLSNLLADDTWAKYKWTPDTSLSHEDNLSTLSFAQDKIAFQLKYLTEIRDEIDAAQTDWITFLQRIVNKEERDAEDNRMGANNTTLNITDILNRTDAMYSQLQAKKFELSLAGQLLHNKIQSAATAAAQLTAAPGLTPGATGESHVRLPVLDMTPFRGNKTEWPEFWENYEAAVHNSRLPVAEKFLYLRKYVQECVKLCEVLDLTYSLKVGGNL